jgi:hypothetical protein
LPYKPHSPEETKTLDAEIKRIEDAISERQSYLSVLMESKKTGKWYMEPAEFKKMIEDVKQGRL